MPIYLARAVGLGPSSRSGAMPASARARLVRCSDNRPTASSACFSSDQNSSLRARPCSRVVGPPREASIRGVSSLTDRSLRAPVSLVLALRAPVLADTAQCVSRSVLNLHSLQPLRDQHRTTEAIDAGSVDGCFLLNSTMRGA